MGLVPIASGLSILCYLVSATLLIRRFFAHHKSNAKIAIVILMLAIIAHLGVIGLSLGDIHHQRLSLSFVLLVVAWLIAFSMFVANKFIRNLVFLPIVAISAALFSALHLLLPTTTGINADMSVGMLLHISLSILSFGFLGIAMLYALQLGYINYQLKHKKRSLLQDDLPPLLAVEDILYKLMSIGAAILLASLISGFAFVPSMFADGYAHKTLLSTLALIIFVFALFLHKIKGIKTRTAIWVNVLGISLLSLSYFGARFVQEVIIGS